MNTSAKTSRLLVITDQKGSSSFTKDKAAKAAKRHFESFIAALPEATVIKNIGDSLMMDVTVTQESGQVSAFLESLLKARATVGAEEIEVSA